MNKYQEASLYYQNLVKYWGAFNNGKDKAYSHSAMISNAIALAKLDLPDPFKDLAVNNEVKDEVKEEPVVTGFVITEPVKEEEAKTTVASVSEEQKPNTIKANFDKKDNWTSWNKSYKK